MSAMQDESADLLGRVEKLERAASSRWKKTREAGLFLLATAGTVMGGVNFLETRSIDRRIMAEQYLEEAWDILAGHPGATIIPAKEHPLHELTLAERKINKALIISPGMPEAHRRKCVVLRRNHKLEGARKECERAIELDSNSAAAFNSLGNVFMEMSRYSEAVAAYERAIEIERDYPAYSNLITTLRLQKNYLKAASVSRWAIGVFPDDAVCYYDLGMVFLEWGREAEAMEQFERAVELDSRMQDLIEDALTKHRNLEQEASGISGEPGA